ncbi:MAG: preprotein translocase subunit YajC [Rhodospirillales bacterium]|jgi:preprotein translocase subunit YajC|nr:preprotein translocase subunit YajC [Rhodospirillales bacterium]
MFISPAYAQDAGAAAGGGIEAILPLVLIFVVFYFLLIRPQQKKAKEHKATLNNIRRGDRIVTGGGIIGSVTKVNDETSELTVEIAKEIKVKVRREMVAHVIDKTEPAAAKGSNDTPKAANEDAAERPSFLGVLFGKKKDK